MQSSRPELRPLERYLPSSSAASRCDSNATPGEVPCLWYPSTTSDHWLWLTALAFLLWLELQELLELFSPHSSLSWSRGKASRGLTNLKSLNCLILLRCPPSSSCSSVTSWLASSHLFSRPWRDPIRSLQKLRPTSSVLWIWPLGPRDRLSLFCLSVHSSLLSFLSSFFWGFLASSLLFLSFLSSWRAAGLLNLFGRTFLFSPLLQLVPEIGQLVLFHLFQTAHPWQPCTPCDHLGFNCVEQVVRHLVSWAILWAKVKAKCLSLVTCCPLQKSVRSGALHSYLKFRPYPLLGKSLNQASNLARSLPIASLKSHFLSRHPLKGTNCMSFDQVAQPKARLVSSCALYVCSLSTTSSRPTQAPSGSSSRPPSNSCRSLCPCLGFGFCC